MNLNNISPENFYAYFLSGTPLIDVRAPIEYELGSLPNSTNLPILNNEEREQIGTIYKQQGSEAALKLGHQLISGPIKNERLEAWLNFIEKNPTAILYCFRGGQRSQITQQWLKDAGIARPLLIGGYKQGRKLLMEKIADFSVNHDIISVCGPTGSGKTQFLNDVRNFYPTIDLEALACHRGSAFGGLATPQPTQINFENQLAMAILTLEQNFDSKISILVEDESRLIGRCVIPTLFFQHIQSSKLLWIDEPLNQRVQNIYQDYILQSPIGCLEDEAALPQFAKYKKSLQSISKKLGGLRTAEVLNLLVKAENEFVETKTLESNRLWIEKLLVYYYDPLYLKSIEKKEIKVIFKGSKSECTAYLKLGENHATS